MRHSKLKVVAALLLSLLLSNCTAPQTYPQGQLADQILVARHGHEGKLTNQVCTTYDKDAKCISWNLIEYDLSQQTFRDTARRLQFICKMGGKRYKICPDRPGICRTTYSCNWFTGIFGGCDKNVEYVPASPTEVLIQSHVKCFSESQYSWESIE